MMENMDDEEIQRLIEEQLKGKIPPGRSEDNDKNLYRVLFAELAKEPSEIKNWQLAEKVIEQILTARERREQIYYGLVIVAIMFLVSGLTYLTMERVDSSTLNTISHFVIANKVVLFFIFFTFCLIQLLDKYLVKRNTPIN